MAVGRKQGDGAIPFCMSSLVYNVTLNHLRSEKKLLCKSTSKQGEDEFRLTFL